MSTKTSEILLHPLRLRIVLALGSEQLTTSELGERLPDVAPATLYRQVATLAEAGLLEVVEEHRIRGGVERTYALVAEAARLGPSEATQMTADELLRGFVVFSSSLIEAFGRYTEQPHAEPGEDPVGYRQAALWLDEEERRELIERLRSAIEPYLANRPDGTRQRLLLNTILIPDLTASSDDGQTSATTDQELASQGR